MKSPCKTTLFAVGIILMIGGAFAAGILHSYLGYVSLSCLAVVPVGILLTVMGACRREALPPSPPEKREPVRQEKASTSFESTSSIEAITNQKTKKDSTSPLIIIVNGTNIKLDLFNQYDVYYPKSEENIPQALMEIPRFGEKIKENERVVIFCFIPVMGRIEPRDWGFCEEIVIGFQDNPNIKLHIVRIHVSSALCGCEKFFTGEAEKANRKNSSKTTIMIYDDRKTFCETSQWTGYAAGTPINESMLKKMAEETFPR